MTPEKLKSLTAYTAEIKAKLASPVPSKHKDRPQAYKAYLTRELLITNAVLNDAVLVKAPGK